MRQAEKKKEKDKVAIVLLLCFAVIALTSIFTVKSNIDKINENASNLPVSEETKTETNDSVDKTNGSSSKQQDTNDKQTSAQIPTVDSLEKVSNFVNPINDPNASVTNPYSMNKLIYSVTLDQYMTHCGIDIEAPEDTQVLAIQQGTVTAVYEDDRYGISIEITHPGNLVSIYSNLSTAEMVEVGDVVTKGQIIGGVGSTGLFESLEPAHLHLEILKEGTYVDPSEYINF